MPNHPCGTTLFLNTTSWRNKNFYLIMFNKIMVKILPRICFILTKYVYITLKKQKGLRDCCFRI